MRWVEQLTEYERGGPAGPCFVAPGFDHDVGQVLLVVAFGKLRSKRREVMPAETDPFARDHDAFGVDDGCNVGNRPADVTSGPLEDLGDRGLAVGESSDVVGLDQPTGRGENLADDGRLGSDRFKAAAAAAPAVRAVRDDLDVTDLAAPAVGSPVDESVDHQPHADAAADRHDEQMRKPAARSKQLLGDGEGVDVVVEQDRQAQTGPPATR